MKKITPPHHLSIKSTIYYYILLTENGEQGVYNVRIERGAIKKKEYFISVKSRPAPRKKKIQN